MKMTSRLAITIFHIATTIVIYFAIYFVYSFTIWKFEYPFEWMTNMPNYHPAARLLILITCLLWQITQYAWIRNMVININEKSKDRDTDGFGGIEDEYEY